MARLARFLGLVTLVALCASVLGAGTGQALERGKRVSIVSAAVEILPLQVEGGRVVNVPWAGSGTIIDPSGLILTNYHVVDENGQWDKLAVLITARSDTPPEPAYLAEIAAKSPRLDLAVLRIVSDLNGRPIDPDRVKLPAVEIGDADALEVGDELNIFGYPAIGGQTITYTQGRVAGFSVEEGVDYQRAWIKTDATISGGNSGGTAVDEDGLLVGVPTQAGYGDADYFADVRPVQDTNGDGVVDEADAPVVLGGFINALRPANLAYQLIESARSGEQVEPGPSKRGGLPGDTEAGSTGEPTFGDIVFASEQTADGLPKNPGTQFPAGDTLQLFAHFDYSGMSNGSQFNYVWTLNGATAHSEAADWEWDKEGSFYLTLANRGQALPSGEYRLVLGVDGSVLQQGTATIGEAPDPGRKPQREQGEGVTVSGTIIDADTGDPIEGAIFVVLKPGVGVREFMKEQDVEMLAAAGQTDRNGQYVLEPPLPRGETYSVLVAAEGYDLLSAEDELNIEDSTPSQVELDPIELSRS
jgi:serine protease Do